MNDILWPQCSDLLLVRQQNAFHFIFWEISSLRLAFFSLISFHFINNCLQTIKWKLRKLINEREEYDLPIPFQKRKKRRWLMAELKLTSSMGHHVSSLFKKGILWPFPRSFKSSLRLTEADRGLLTVIMCFCGPISFSLIIILGAHRRVIAACRLEERKRISSSSIIFFLFEKEKKKEMDELLLSLLLGRQSKTERLGAGQGSSSSSGSCVFSFHHRVGIKKNSKRSPHIDDEREK